MMSGAAEEGSCSGATCDHRAPDLEAPSSSGVERLELPSSGTPSSSSSSSSSIDNAGSSSDNSQVPRLPLSDLANEAQPSAPNSPVSECFLCCEGEQLPGNPLIFGVCSCKHTAMHLDCQRRMLEVALTAETPITTATRCGVCHSAFANASTLSYCSLSWLGALWCTCCIGVIVMLWSGSESTGAVHSHGAVTGCGGLLEGSGLGSAASGVLGSGLGIRCSRRNLPLKPHLNPPT